MMHVPVHRHPLLAEQLHAIHANVVARRLARANVIRMDRVNPRERDVSPAKARIPVGTPPQPLNAIIHVRRIPQRRKVPIVRPTPDDRQPCQINRIARDHHVLTRAAPRAPLRRNLQQRRKLLRLREQVPKTLGRLRLRQFRQLPRQHLKPARRVPRCNAAPRIMQPQRHLHPPIRPKRIDEHRHIRAFNILKQQRRPAPIKEPRIRPPRPRAGQPGGTHLADAIRNRRDLQHRIHPRLHAHQLPRRLERCHELSEVFVHDEGSGGVGS